MLFNIKPAPESERGRGAGRYALINTSRTLLLSPQTKGQGMFTPDIDRHILVADR